MSSCLVNWLRTCCYVTVFHFCQKKTWAANIENWLARWLNWEEQIIWWHYESAMWYVMWSHIPLSPACSLLLPRVVIHQLIWRKRWPGSPVMWFAIACFLLFTKVLWIEAFSVHKCSVLSYLWHENNKIILFSTRYCVSAVIKFHAVLTNNNTCESSNWKMKRYYTSKCY